MSMSMPADGSTETMAQAIREAADQLETIAATNADLKTRCENEDWSGLERINQAEDAISATRDGLEALAEDIGVGGAIVREAHQQNSMVGTKESVVGQ